MKKQEACFLMSAVYVAPLVPPEVGVMLGIVFSLVGVGFVLLEVR
jgi:hypothetical protein